MVGHYLIVGRRSTPFADIDTALVEAEYGNVDLQFGSAHGTRVVVRVRAGSMSRTRQLDSSTVLTILRASRIVMPTSGYDPTGRFAQWNFPHNVTREQAIELVLRPPGPDDRLPISRWSR